MMKKNSTSLLGAGILTAFAASLCCITPVLALLGGISGVAASFSWLEPARPYLIGLTVLVIGFAWYQKLKPGTSEDIECDCEEDEKPSFWQSRKFLGIVTVMAAFMLAFPYYSGIFFSVNNPGNTITVKEHDVVEASLSVEGMTCTGCEHSVNHALSHREGVLEASSSYETGTATVKFDKTKVSIDDLATAVELETGYTVPDKRINH